MMPRFGLSIDITHREAPYIVIAGGGAALGVFADAPPGIVIPVATLVALRVTVRLRRQQRA